MSSLAPYPSPEEREARFDELAAALGAEVRVLGESVNHRPIRIARVLCTRPGVEERVLLSANIHGVELIASRLALGFLEALVDPSPALARLRERAEIWVLPSINPDGYARTWEWEGRGRLKDLRPNANGVDLNRNFPLPGPQPWWALSLGGFATGSSDPTNSFYRGPAALSEPETAAVAALCQSTPFVASANLHSFMGTLLPAHVEDRAHFATYRALGDAFRREQTGPRYRCTSSRMVDWLTGEMEDYQHHTCGTWSICVEIFSLAASIRQHLRAPSLFWRFNPRDPERWVANDVPGLTSYFHAALDLGPPR